LTIPCVSTVSVPVIQLQGYVSESLGRLTLDVSNGAGLHWLESSFLKTYQCILIVCVMVAFTAFAGSANGSEWGALGGTIQISVRLKEGGTEIKTNQQVDLVVRLRNLPPKKA